MRPAMIVGILLIALGLVALAYHGISYTTRERVIDVGSIHATVERRHTVPMPPLMGVAALAAGVALVIVGGRRN